MIDPAKTEYLILQKLYKDQIYRNIILDNFDSRCYDNKKIAKLIKIIKQFNENYEKIPSLNAMQLICEKVDETGNLYKTFDKSLKIDLSEDPKLVRDAIISRLQNKKMYYSIMDNIENITEKKDIDSVIKDFQHIAQIDVIENLGLNFFDDIDEHMDEVCNPEELLPTLYKQLDKALNGGVLANGKSLYVFMAQAGLGKSLFLSNLAVNFLIQGKTVAVISLEMSELIYGKRIDAHISGYDINHLPEHRDGVVEKIKDFKQMYNSTLFIKEYPPNTINCHTVEAYLNKLQNSIDKKIDVIIIDYINLLQPNTEVKDAGMYERIGDVSRDMRALSYEFTAPVISATQINRDGYDTSDISMNNVSESMGIAHTAEFLGALWQQEGDREANRINLNVIKNRNGIVGRSYEFDINYSSLRIMDISDEEMNTEEVSITDDILNDLM